MSDARWWWYRRKPLTPEGSFRLTKEVFVEAEKRFPDLMEPWSSRLGDSESPGEQQRIMREGLAATFKRRFPMPETPDMRESA